MYEWTEILLKKWSIHCLKKSGEKYIGPPDGYILVKKQSNEYRNLASYEEK